MHHLFDEGAFDTANLLAILAGGRAPEWEAQSTQAGGHNTTAAPLRPPELASDGVALSGNLFTMIDVPLRITGPHRRRGIVTIGTFDATTSYTVTLGGNAFTSTTPADLATALSDLATAINAHADYTASVVTTTVVFYGATDADFSIVPSRSGGTGTLSTVADPSSAPPRFYGIGASVAATAPETWKSVLGVTAAPSLAADFRGVLGPMPTAGLSRVYVEVDSLAGHASDSTGTGGTLTYATPVVTIGPCILENE